MLQSKFSLLLVFCLLMFIVESAFGFITPGGKYFFSADDIEYNQEEEFISASGNIEIIIDEFIITSDTIKYDLHTDQIWVEGNVIIKEGKEKLVLADKVMLKDKLKFGIIADFIIKFNKDNAVLAANLATRINKNHFKLEKSTFTPCLIKCNSKPIWQLSAKEVDLNFEQQKIIYRNLFFEVYGVPILFTPYFAHPTPNAKAQSGFLTPSVRNNKFVVPLYVRAKPNMDFTISPMVARKYLMFEFQERHKLTNGYYQVDGNYGKVPYKDKKVSSAYFSSHGSFYSQDFKYGFDIERASDKVYLKNYLNKNQAYLLSKLYLNKIQKYNYSIVEAMSFQNLNSVSTDPADPLILPKIRTKTVIDLGEKNNTYLVVKSDVINYRDSVKKVDRGSLELSLVNDVISSRGHMLSQTLQTRGDLYITQNTPKKDLFVNLRAIPEIHNMWRYPLIKYCDSYSITIEPIVLAIVGSTTKINLQRFHQIDPYKLNIDASNLFITNHYSGIDYHESGNRLNYGFNITSLVDDNYHDVFIGQFLHKDWRGNIGRFSMKLHNAVSLAYAYKYDAHFNPIKDELAINLRHKNAQINTSLIKLSNLKKYHAVEGFSSTENKIIQAGFDVDYQINSNWSVQYGEKMDISKRIRPLQRTIKMTYMEDCVSVAIQLYDDYTFDQARGIKRVHNKSALIGLKIINM